MSEQLIQWHKAKKPIAQLLLAHGAGAGSDSEFMQVMATLLVNFNINVGLFDFEYMQLIKQNGKRRPPDRAPKLLCYYNKMMLQCDKVLPLFIGGKSMGGRMASMLSSESLEHEFTLNAEIRGVIAYGYPFHPPKQPEKLRTDHFSGIACPFLIVQGQRDTFGTELEVKAMTLPERIKKVWIADGDHSLIPRKRSGFTQAQNWQTAAEQSALFIAEALND